MRRGRSHVRGAVVGPLARLLQRPIAHRGLHGCGSAPIENSLGAARAAIAGDYNIECDVRLTRDGQLVVFHDDALARLAGEDALVRDLTLAELARLRLRDGQEIPTLQALLRVVDGRVVTVIEVKTKEGDAAALAAALAEAIAPFAEHVAVESFDAWFIEGCATLPCPVGLVGDRSTALGAVPQLQRCEFLSWSYDAIGEAADAFPHLPRTAWTVRSQQQRSRAQEAQAQIVFEGFLP